MSEGRIRLTCSTCSREDFDGVDQLPADWEDIIEVQSWEESIREIAPDDPDGNDAPLCKVSQPRS